MCVSIAIAYFLKKTENRVAAWYSNLPPGYIASKNYNLKGYMWPYGHCSIINNSQDMEEN